MPVIKPILFVCFRNPCTCVICLFGWFDCNKYQWPVPTNSAFVYLPDPLISHRNRCDFELIKPDFTNVWNDGCVQWEHAAVIYCLLTFLVMKSRKGQIWTGWFRGVVILCQLFVGLTKAPLIIKHLFDDTEMHSFLFTYNSQVKLWYCME